MEKNIGSNDKLVRIVAGALLGLVSLSILAGYLELSELYSLVLGVISLILLVTGLTGKCGLYNVVGINTCKAE